MLLRPTSKIPKQKIMSLQGLWFAGVGVLCVMILSGCSPVFVDTAAPEFQERYQSYDYCGIRAVKQSRDNSCGSACLASVADYWDIELTEQQILTEYPKAPKEGYSLLELKAIAMTRGLDAYMLSMSDNPIQQLHEQLSKGRPVICAVSFPQLRYFAYDVPLYGSLYRAVAWSVNPRLNHYVVAFGFKEDELLVMDPVRGFVTMPYGRFESAWSKKKYAVLLCARKSDL